MASDAEFPDRESWLFDKVMQLQKKTRICAAYHAKRERFYGIWERVFQAATALTATAAFADIAGNGDTTKWWAVFAAAGSIIPLVFGFADRARLHGQLKSGFKGALAAMYAAGVEPNEEQYNLFRSQIAKLEADEPAQLGALTIQCENEVAAAARGTIYPLKFWERFGMHYFNFDATHIVSRDKKTAA